MAFAPASTWKGSGLILIVDDDENIRKITARVLQAHGFNVVQAANGRDAVQFFSEKAAEFRAVLLNMVLPHMSGAEVFQELRKLRPGIDVILISGWTVQEVAAALPDQKTVVFLKKPFSGQDLIGKLREILKD